MMKESDILFEVGDYWVSTAKSDGLTWKGYVVWRTDLTHSKLVARIGFEGNEGLERAKQEANKRAQH